MLLWLSVWLAKYFHAFHAFHAFQYLTLRAILGVLTALFTALFLGPMIIRRLSVHRVKQVVREDGPKSHLSKAGTPTMGGLLVWGSILITVLVSRGLSLQGVVERGGCFVQVARGQAFANAFGVDIDAQKRGPGHRGG